MGTTINGNLVFMSKLCNADISAYFNDCLDKLFIELGIPNQIFNTKISASKAAIETCYDRRRNY